MAQRLLRTTGENDIGIFGIFWYLGNALSGCGGNAEKVERYYY
jgi:hypothetical protein